MLLNAALLALWPVLPVLIVCYLRQSLIAHRMRPTFALRNSETDELDRAYGLFGRVCQRIKRISRQAEPKAGLRRFFGACHPKRAPPMPMKWKTYTRTHGICRRRSGGLLACPYSVLGTGFTSEALGSHAAPRLQLTSPLWPSSSRRFMFLRGRHGCSTSSWARITAPGIPSTNGSFRLTRSPRAAPS